jgi:hypothetical protein
MKITMLSPTYRSGKRLKPGDTVDVDETTGARWEKAGIAEKPPAKPAKTTDKE